MNSALMDNAEYIAKFGTNLTAKVLAKQEEFQTFERDTEMKHVARILIQDIKNSPILIGQAGVGKTAIVEGLALAIALNPDSYPELAGKEIISFQMSAFMSEGDPKEFTKNFEKTLEELIINSDKYIAFIDEIHQIVGTGAMEGSALNAGNMLKPALGRGELHLIGATTSQEYHEFIETDRALKRRFDPVMINELTEEQTIQTLSKVKKRFELSKGITIPDNLLPAITNLAARYNTTEFFPEKAIMILDAASATTKMNAHSVMGLSDINQVMAEKFNIPMNVLNETADYRLANLYKNVTAEVIGQDNAIKRIVNRMKAKAAGLGNIDKPLSIWLGGPTGVGKTETGKQIAKHYFGTEDSMIRFDMSEFRPGTGVQEKFSERLSTAVQFKPYSLILFDEVEKAFDAEGHSDVMDLLLQVLDDGRLTDEYGQVINFKNTVILFTSNVGHKEIQNFAEKGDEYRYDKSRIQTFNDEYELSMLGIGFRQEFISRLDEIIIFQPLDKEDALAIVDLKLNKLAKQTANKGYYLIYKSEQLNELIPGFSDGYEEIKNKSSELIRIGSYPIDWFLFEEGYRPSRGIRPLTGTISQYIEDVIATSILEERITGNRSGNTFIFRARGVAPDKQHTKGDWAATFNQANLSEDDLMRYGLKEVGHDKKTV